MARKLNRELWNVRRQRFDRHRRMDLNHQADRCRNGNSKMGSLCKSMVGTLLKWTLWTFKQPKIVMFLKSFLFPEATIIKTFELTLMK